ncbi:hypothetical protein [Chelativorans sp.]|uniref:hypothetical protein n=1 Tax=Chelativorans sp. TaxID=2203393 RepID=UPI002811758C|nr:hypothetical protein [Chelativorans sp.]
MLARPEKFRCIECSKPFGAPDFACYYGQIESGPAYWSDRGMLCSLECSLRHHRQRMAEGTLSSAPAADPFEED